MTRNAAILIWAPRLLSLVFVMFLSLFALDVFSEYEGLDMVAPLVIHLVPSMVLLAGVALAWRWDLVGAGLFLGAAVAYVWMVGLDRHWSWYAAISGPCLLVGMLYIASWRQKRRAP